MDRVVMPGAIEILELDKQVIGLIAPLDVQHPPSSREVSSNVPSAVVSHICHFSRRTARIEHLETRTTPQQTRLVSSFVSVVDQCQFEVLVEAYTTTVACVCHLQMQRPVHVIAQYYLLQNSS